MGTGELYCTSQTDHPNAERPRCRNLLLLPRSGLGEHEFGFPGQSNGTPGYHSLVKLFSLQERITHDSIINYYVFGTHYIMTFNKSSGQL